MTAIGFRHDLDVDIRRHWLGLCRHRVERDDVAAPDFGQAGGVRRLDIVGPPVHPVDDEMQAVAQLVPAFGDTSGGFRRLIQIVFGLSIAFAASSFFLSFFSFSGGALV